VNSGRKKIEYVGECGVCFFLNGLVSGKMARFFSLISMTGSKTIIMAKRKNLPRLALDSEKVGGTVFLKLTKILDFSLPPGVDYCFTALLHFYCTNKCTN
jgi:hypothetical protein